MTATGPIDLQVNGYAGVDFNAADVTPEQIQSAAHRLREDGIAGILATVITAAPERMIACLRALAAARSGDSTTREVILGFHVEGPFLCPEPGYIGAHPPDETCAADRHRAEQLLDAGEGHVRLFTLSPERDPDGTVTRHLAERGIRVAAGHTNASLEALKVGVENGLTLFTHLGNGCPIHLHRHDNIIQRALHLRTHLHFGLIADGIHLPPFVLRNFIDGAGLDRCFIVTDAMAAAGLGPGRHTLGDRVADVDESLAVWSADRSHLMGSAASFARAFDVLREVGFGEEEIRRLTRETPAKLLERTTASN